MTDDLKEKIDELIPEGIKDLGTAKEVEAVESAIEEGVESVETGVAKAEAEAQKVEGEVHEKLEEFAGAKVFTSVKDLLSNLPPRHHEE